MKMCLKGVVSFDTLFSLCRQLPPQLAAAAAAVVADVATVGAAPTGLSKVVCLLTCAMNRNE